MTDRAKALRDADLAMADIDRLLDAPRNTPIDDLVYHPLQAVVNIADCPWYQKYARSDRTPGGRLRFSDATAQKHADATVAPHVRRNAEFAKSIEDGGNCFCWHCGLLVPRSAWSPVEGDDVCADCRDRIAHWEDHYVMNVPDDPSQFFEGSDYDEEVDGIPITMGSYRPSIFQLKEI